MIGLSGLLEPFPVLLISNTHGTRWFEGLDFCLQLLPLHGISRIECKQHQRLVFIGKRHLWVFARLVHWQHQYATKLAMRDNP